MKQTNPFLNVLAAAGMTVEQFNEKTKDMSTYDRAHEKIKMIVDHLNGPNPGKCIYYPWFLKEEVPSGSGLSFHAAVYDFSATIVPARLKYRTREIAKTAGGTFMAEYKEFLLSKQ